MFPTVKPFFSLRCSNQIFKLVSNHYNVAKEPPAPEPKKEDAKPEPAPESKPADDKAAPINPKTYHARLGLARAYRAAGDIDQSKKFYNEVMTMAPEVRT